MFQAIFALLMFAVPAAHWFAQMKGTYGLTRFRAAWRTVAITFAAVMTLALYLATTLTLGLID